MVLRIRIVEIRGGVMEHLRRARWVTLYARVRDTGEVIGAERDEGLRDNPGMGRVRGFHRPVYWRFRNSRRISLVIVLPDAIAKGIHPAKRRLRGDVALAGRKAERLDGLLGIAAPEAGNPGPDRITNRFEQCPLGRGLRRRLLDVERITRDRKTSAKTRASMAIVPLRQATAQPA